MPRTLVDVRRAEQRPVTRTATTLSRHALSFGAHYDPANTSYGPLVALNEEHVAPGGGFAPHPHRELEIVTWVLEGALRHADHTGRQVVLPAGAVQVLSAGTGVVHSETNDAWRLDPAAPRDVPLRFVQCWLTPASPGGAAAYAHARPELGRLAPVVSGLPEVEAPLHTRAAAVLHAGRLEPGEPVELPSAPYVLLLVTRGQVDLEDDVALGPGDEARLADAGPRTVRARAASELLVWQLQP